MIVYLILTMGVTVSAHYCGGKVTSVSYNPIETKHKCPCGNKIMPRDCCKDETATFQLDDEQKKTQQILCNALNGKEFQSVISAILSFDYHSPILVKEFDYSTHPPNDVGHPLYIRHRVFRI